MIFSQAQLEAMGAAAARYRAERDALELEAEPAAQLVATDEQLGLDGSRRDCAPASERLRLFEPAPVQIPGQLGLELEGGD